MATAQAFDKFVKFVYNGFEIIINNKDKYFNASKIVSKYSHKKLNDYMRNKDFVEFSNEIKNVEHAEIPVSYLPNKSFVFIYHFVNSQKLNKSMYFICHFLPGKILPGKNLKTLFFYQILFE